MVLGEGSLAHALKFDATAAGIPLIVRGWAEREDVLRALARATALVFPSLWPEPLSRVLLEALGPGHADGGHGHRRHAGDPGEERAACWWTTRRPWATRWPGWPATTPSARGSRRRPARGPQAFAPAALVPRYEAVYRRLA